MLGPEPRYYRICWNGSPCPKYVRKTTHRTHHCGVRSFVRSRRHRRHQDHRRPRLLRRSLHHGHDRAVHRRGEAGRSRRSHLDFRHPTRTGRRPRHCRRSYRHAGIGKGGQSGRRFPLGDLKKPIGELGGKCRACPISSSTPSSSPPPERIFWMPPELDC